MDGSGTSHTKKRKLGQIKSESLRDDHQTYISDNPTPENSSNSSLVSQNSLISPTDQHSYPTGGNCGICYEMMKEQGVMDSCGHEFCFECIERWSQITNRCPICKSEFSFIRRRELRPQEGSKSKKPRLVEVARKEQVYEYSQEELEELARMQSVPTFEMASTPDPSLALFPWLDLDEEEASVEESTISPKRGTSRDRLRTVLSQPRTQRRTKLSSERGKCDVPLDSSLSRLEFLRNMFGSSFEDEIIRMVLEELSDDVEKAVNTLLNMQVSPLCTPLPPSTSSHVLYGARPARSHSTSTPNTSPAGTNTSSPDAKTESNSTFVSSDIEQMVWQDFETIRSASIKQEIVAKEKRQEKPNS